jgi:hypothetical protein
LLLCIISKGDLDENEIYRALALTAAHLHLMTRHHFAVYYEDQQDSVPRFRPCRSMENHFFQKNIRV